MCVCCDGPAACRCVCVSVCPSQKVRCVGHVTCVALPLVAKGSGCASSPFTLFPHAPAAFSAVGLRRRSPAAMATRKRRDPAGGLCVCTVVRLFRNGRMCVCVHTFTPEHTWLHLWAPVSAFRRVPPLALSTAGGVYVSQTVRVSCYANAGASASASSAGTRETCIAGQTQLQVQQSTSGNVSRTLLVRTG